ncbi:hypothetical protein KY362_05265, partial [Candidatus Woesearchaeota archaeon]|nr:hypothetical protein [Candidatus Woesearchaeota archaeon]
MKKIQKNLAIPVVLAVMILLFTGIAYADRDTYVSGASIRVSMISQDPDPVEPGEYIELRWMVTNSGSQPLPDVPFR